MNRLIAIYLNILLTSSSFIPAYKCESQGLLFSLNYHLKGKNTELTPADFREIFQLALDLPELQGYFHVQSDVTREQIVIQDIGEANHNDLIGVEKFGKEIKLLAEEEIKLQQIKHYFVLGDWVCGLNTVRMQLSYVGEGLTISYVFNKIEGKWTIVNSEIWEE